MTTIELPGYETRFSRNNTKMHNYTPITTNTPGNLPPWTVAGQLVLDMEAGDILLLSSTAQYSVAMTYATDTVGMIRYLFNGNYIVPSNPKADEGILVRPMGENRWLSPHYRVDGLIVFWVCPADGEYTFQHVCYGASSAYTGNPADFVGISYYESRALVLRPVDGTIVDDITALRSDVEDLTSTMITMSNRISDQETTIVQQRMDIDALTGRVTDLEAG